MPQLPLWEEMWWDDGQLHSQPTLDFVGEPTFVSPVSCRIFYALSSVTCSRTPSNISCWAVLQRIRVTSRYASANLVAGPCWTGCGVNTLLYEHRLKELL